MRGIATFGTLIDSQPKRFSCLTNGEIHFSNHAAKPKFVRICEPCTQEKGVVGCDVFAPTRRFQRRFYAYVSFRQVGLKQLAIYVWRRSVAT